MSVTIIGCGWLGLPLGKELVLQGYSVNGSVRTKSGFQKLQEAGIDPFQLDLENDVKVETHIIESTKTLIICIPPIHRERPKKYELALIQLLDQFKDNSLVIFTSSTGIYPRVAGDFNEEFQFSTKQESSILNLSESAIRESKKNCVIFRLGGLVGPNRHPIWQLKGKKGLKNPLGLINFVHRGDCIKAITEALKNSDLRGTFNLVYPIHPTRKDYYLQAAEHYGLASPSFTDDPPMKRVISSQKIIDTAAFSFEFPIDVYPKLNFS